MKTAFFAFLLVALTGVFAADKIAVDFFFETLCPGCVELYAHCLYKYMKHPDLMNVSTITTYPFGNGKIVTESPPKFTCQHGPEECYLNTVEACVVRKYPQAQWAEFLYCLETAQDKRGSIPACAKKADVDYKNLIECTEGPEGSQLMLEIAKATPSDHRYVPWVTVDGKHIDEYDVVEAVCEKISGSTKPASCESFTCSGAEFKGRSRNMGLKEEDAHKPYHKKLLGGRERRHFAHKNRRHHDD